MLLDIKDSGKGNVADVTGEHTAGTLVTVDTVYVNKSPVWKRYMFEVYITVLPNNKIDMTLTGATTVKVIDVTTSVESDLGHTNSIAASSIERKYKLIQDSSITGLKFITPGIKSFRASSLGGIVVLDDFLNGMNTVTTITFDRLSGIEKVTSMNRAFKDCVGITETPEIYAPLCSGFEETFKGCILISRLNPGQFGMNSNAKGMFEGCTSLQHLAIIDFSFVSDASFMFKGTNLDRIDNMNLSSTTTLESTFEGIPGITEIYLKVSSKLTTIKNMCRGLQNLTRFTATGPTNPINAETSFEACPNLLHVNINAHMTNGHRAFADCPQLLQAFVALPELVNGEEMFLNGTRINIGVFNKGGPLKLVNAKRMFKGCAVNFTNNELVMPLVEDLTECFNGANFRIIEKFSAPSCKTAKACFKNARIQQAQHFDFGTACVDMSECFMGNDLMGIPPVIASTAANKDFTSMFEGCAAFPVVNKKYDTANGLKFDKMFKGCAAARCLDKINTTKTGATKVDMFAGTAFMNPTAAEITEITSTAGKNYINANVC